MTTQTFIPFGVCMILLVSLVYVVYTASEFDC